MKTDFWHLVLGAVIVIVAAWLIIKVVGALVGFVLWLMSILLILAVIGALIYLGFLVLRPKRSGP